jgi:hypothetical protein
MTKFGFLRKIRPKLIQKMDSRTKLAECHAGSVDSYEKPGDVDDDDADDAETPKAADNIHFVRLPPPSPPPLTQHNYVKGFTVPTLAVKIPAQAAGENDLSNLGTWVRTFVSPVARGRCYDHNFLRFLPIFGEKIGVFSQTNNIMIKIFV